MAQKEAHAPPVVRRQETTLLLTDQTNILPFKKVVVSFLGLALCIVVSILDSVVVATAMPTITSAFNAGAIVSWVPAGYLLTSTSFQPLYGRFSDIFGRKPALCVAMSIFAIGNLLAGFSKTIIQLIVFRGIAGAGEGGIISMAQIAISDIVSLRKYQGFMGGVIAFGYTIGPLIGGALAQNVSWRWCFWISIPTAAMAIVVVLYILPFKPVGGNLASKLAAIDYFGSFLTLAGCTLVLLPLIWGGVTFPWRSPAVLAPLCSGFFVLIIFCFWEWKGARLPIVPMYIFKHSTVSGVYITMFINGFVYFSSIYYIPQFFQVVLGNDPLRSGTFLIPLLVSQMFVSWIAGLIVSRTGRYRIIIHTGFSLWSIACGLISTITQKSPKALLVVYMLLAGMGAGQTLQTTTVAAQASVERKDMSVVTAFRNFVRALGGTLALAVGSTFINNALRKSALETNLEASMVAGIINNPSKILSSPSISPSATETLLGGYTKGFRAVFILNATLTAAATIASIAMIKHKELIRADEQKVTGDLKEKETSEGSPNSIKTNTGDEESGVADRQ
ncbi:major facilitator superfamily domain-containing protein [Cyathus striatus]|nr:major facilitator superfamily domain-containing protein [Cyathus striatus]